MSALVDLEAASSRVAFAADFASKGLVTGVYELVRFQVPLRDEPLPTVFKAAEEWALTSLKGIPTVKNCAIWLTKIGLHGCASES